MINSLFHYAIILPNSLLLRIKQLGNNNLQKAKLAPAKKKLPYSRNNTTQFSSVK
jgi:hypothetical protein